MIKLPSKQESQSAGALAPGEPFSESAAFALQVRLIIYAVAAPAVLLIGGDWPGGLAGYIVFFLALSTIFDLLNLVGLSIRLGVRRVSFAFSILHVGVVGAALASIGWLAGTGSVAVAGEVSGPPGLLVMAGSPAPILFFSAVIFSLAGGISVLPVVIASLGAVFWLALCFTGLTLSGLHPLSVVSTGGFDLGGSFAAGLPARALIFSTLGSVLLIGAGFALRQALLQAIHQADQVDIRRRRRDLLSQFLSPHQAGRLAELDTVFDQVTEHDCAVLLVDISHFQRKMETAALGEAGQLIQEFHELVSQVVFKNGGLLRQMEGDSLYAVFGLLEEERSSVERAFLCAQTMAEAARMWRSERIDRGKSPAEIYMGIDFGRCVIVPNASPDRPEFSMVGAPFSASRRMERVARLVASDMAMTGHAVQQLKEGGAAALCSMMDHRGPQKVDDRRGVVEVRTWSLPLSGQADMENVA